MRVKRGRYLFSGRPLMHRKMHAAKNLRRAYGAWYHRYALAVINNNQQEKFAFFLSRKHIARAPADFNIINIISWIYIYMYTTTDATRKILSRSASRYPRYFCFAQQWINPADVHKANNFILRCANGSISTVLYSILTISEKENNSRKKWKKIFINKRS